ncbi:MAG: hypothetical protein H7239_00130 [Flavobacterium sp.]|nr:hypothetical protein [Flavobacterium sp.]
MNTKKIFRQDYNQTKSLVKAERIIDKNAVRQSKALNLVVTYIENGIVFEGLPVGSKKQIEVLEKNQPKLFSKKEWYFIASNKIVRIFAGTNGSGKSFR